MAKKAKTAKVANAMDYAEHDKTYNLFLNMSIWTTVICVALLIAMAFGFFGGGGLIGGTLLFAVICAACKFVI